MNNENSIVPINEDLNVANTNDDIYIKFSQSPKNYKYALVRTIGIKVGVN